MSLCLSLLDISRDEIHELNEASRVVFFSREHLMLNNEILFNLFIFVDLSFLCIVTNNQFGYFWN